MGVPRSGDATLRDDRVHAARELGGGDERRAERIAGLRAGIELADPELDARRVAAPPEERVVEVAHVLRIRAVARRVFRAVGETARDGGHLRVHRAGALALRGTELLHPE